jgi:5'(3')-deoxyribonucleotidase
MTRIALDVDDVLADTQAKIIETINRKWNINLKLEDVTEWEIEKGFKISAAEYFDIYKHVWKNEWKSILPLATNEEIKSLINKYQVDLVTSRDGETLQPLKQWISTHFPALSNTRIIITETISKKAELNYDYYIDDAPILANVLKEKKTAKLFIVSRPWNAKVQAEDNIIRVKDLKEAIGILTNRNG